MTRAATVSFGLALCVCLAASTASRADEKINISGNWTFEVDLGGNSGSPMFTFKQEGEKLTGTYKGQFGEAKLTGKVKGKEIEFSFDIEGGKVTYTGTIEKDTMKGKCTYADQASGTWTGKKS
jgi:hypothetical protein